MKANFWTDDGSGNTFLVAGLIGFITIFFVAYFFKIDLSGIFLTLNYGGIASFIFSISLFVLVCVWIFVGLRIIRYFDTSEENRNPRQ